MIIPMTIMYLLMLPFIWPIIVLALPFAIPIGFIGALLGEIVPNSEFLRSLGEWLSALLGLS